MLRLFLWLICPFIMLPVRWRRLGETARTAGIVWMLAAACILAAALIFLLTPHPSASHTASVDAGYDVKLVFPADRYPETADHIRDAIAEGESPICTIDRNKADAHRQASLEGIPTKKGYDRDEWPMAMCAEGGAGADIRYVTPSDNRGAGSWIGNELDSYADGTKVLIVIEGTINAGTYGQSEAGTTGSAEAPQADVNKQADKTSPKSEAAAGSGSAEPSAAYRSCTAVRQAGAAPLHKGDPGYSLKLDRDGDGVACE